MFTDAQRRGLVAWARAAIVEQLTGRRPDVAAPADLPEASGAFVTLKRRGELRGCIGTLTCRGPLSEEVARVAVSAAIDDPRFARMTARELEGLEVEVSVLGPLERIDPRDPEAIVLGRHGLVVEDGGHRGLLLPQVATEHAMDRDTFLAQTCRKAGLSPDAWRVGAAVYRFDAEVFGD